MMEWVSDIKSATDFSLSVATYVARQSGAKIKPVPVPVPETEKTI
jgi:hypothetical protein